MTNVMFETPESWQFSVANSNTESQECLFRLTSNIKEGVAGDS